MNCHQYESFGELKLSTAVIMRVKKINKHEMLEIVSGTL